MAAVGNYELLQQTNSYPCAVGKYTVIVAEMG